MNPAKPPLQIALDISPVPMVVTDAAGRIVAVNAHLERLFGYDAGALVGRPVEDIVPARFRARHVADRAAYAAHAEPRPMGAGRELFGLHREGREIPVEIGLNPIETSEGRRVVATVVDLTARKEAERALRASEERLLQSQKLEAVGTLAGGIAHDFNNVLATIFAASELVRMRAGNPEEVREHADAVLAAADRGRELVRRILAFGRPQPSQRTALALGEPVGEAVQFLRSSLPSSIAIRATLDPDTPRVLADPTQIVQVLLNLGTNAAHALPGGVGSIELKIEAAHVDTTLTRRHPELNPGPHARLTVRDDGAGMSEEVRQRAFEPFFTTKPPGSGTGLGLSIIHAIVQAHGGAIELHSAPGRGTTVEILLPAVAGAPQVIERRAVEASPGRGERLLLVDDEVTLGRLLARQLERLGYAVTVHASSPEALADFERRPHEFDLAVCDLTMPKLGGADLAERIHAVRPDLPVLLMSGYVAALAPEVRERSGALDVLSKPIRIETLAAAIRAGLTAK